MSAIEDLSEYLAHQDVENTSLEERHSSLVRRERANMVACSAALVEAEELLKQLRAAGSHAAMLALLPAVVDALQGMARAKRQAANLDHERDVLLADTSENLTAFLHRTAQLMDRAVEE